MLLGPIFSVELVTTGRRTRYFIVRVVYASIMLIVLWTICSEEFSFRRTSSIQEIAARATYFFVTFAWVQLSAVLLLGPALAAGTVAVERERRTIEYLFVTDLSNAEVVLGKLAARLLAMASIVLVGLPILAIFRLLGGIPNNLLLVLFIITTSTMVTVGAVSVCISVWSPRARDAVMRTYLILLAALLLPILLHLFALVGAGPTKLQALEPAFDLLLAPNPLAVFFSLLQGSVVAGASIDWGEIQTMVLGQMILTVACMLLATVAVRRVHMRAAGTSTSRWRRRLQFPTWRPQLGRHPMLWKELFARHATTRLGLAGNIALALLATTVIVTSLWVFALVYGRNPGPRPSDDYVEYSSIMGTTVGCVILLLIAARAAATVTGERDRECWVSLLSTPLSAEEIVLAKVVGNLYSARWLFAILLLVWGLNLPLTPSYLLVLPFAIGTLVVTALFASALGVMVSLASKTTLWSMGSTLATAVFVGGGYLFVCCLPVLIGGVGAEEFILVSFIPFLLVWPNVAYQSILRDVWIGSEFKELMPTYAVGMVTYAIASLALVGWSIANFDRLSGRTLAAPDGCGGNRRRPPKRANRDIVVPEVVEEE